MERGWFRGLSGGPVQPGYQVAESEDVGMEAEVVRVVWLDWGLRRWPPERRSQGNELPLKLPDGLC